MVRLQGHDNEPRSHGHQRVYDRRCVYLLMRLGTSESKEAGFSWLPDVHRTGALRRKELNVVSIACAGMEAFYWSRHEGT